MKRLHPFLFLLLLSPLSVQADILLLVHGYMGSPYSWETSGVNTVLAQNGWPRGGILRAGPAGVELLPGNGAQAKNRTYSAELPSLAPMVDQAVHLQVILDHLRQYHPDERITIVAHSAGGVAARLALVQSGANQVDRLITIASPHLGTARALEALDATSGSGPLGIVRDIFGGDTYQAVKHSWGVLLDLVPAHPGSLLYWLNAQPHPDIEYISVVRTGPVGLGDELVPVFSQDLNNVYMLQGLAQTRVSNAGHALLPADGQLVADLVKAAKTPAEETPADPPTAPAPEVTETPNPPEAAPAK